MTAKNNFTSTQPFSIPSYFKGITLQQARSIIAGIYSSEENQASIFFKDGTYIKYSLESNNIVSGYPLQISKDFPGFLNSDAVNLAAITRNESDSIMFIFKDGRYLSYEKGQNKLIPHTGELRKDFSDISQSQASNIASVIQY